jgi:hypothetical protein
VYLDDVIIISRHFQEQFDSMRKVFQKLGEARLKRNPEKYHLFEKGV